MRVVDLLSVRHYRILFKLMKSGETARHKTLYYPQLQQDPFTQGPPLAANQMTAAESNLIFLSCEV